MRRPYSLIASLVLSLLLCSGCASENEIYIKKTVRKLVKTYPVNLQRINSGRGRHQKTGEVYKYKGWYKEQKVYLALERDNFKSLNSLILSTALEKEADFSIHIKRRNELSKLFRPRGMSATPALYHEYVVDSDYEKKAVDYLGGFPVRRHLSRLKNFERLAIGPRNVTVFYESKYSLTITPDQVMKIFETLIILSHKLSIRLFQRYERFGKRYWGRHLWARGYCVSTVGLDEERVRKYVRWQTKKEKQLEQTQQNLFA